jgi:hypothetical protein
MALTPIDETHARQIQAGTLGRRAGHIFEDTITSQINEFQYPFEIATQGNGHVFTGDPASLLLNYTKSCLNTIVILLLPPASCLLPSLCDNIFI